MNAAETVSIYASRRRRLAEAIGAGVASLIAMAKVLRIAEFDEAQAVAWGWARKFLPD